MVICLRSPSAAPSKDVCHGLGVKSQAAGICHGFEVEVSMSRCGRRGHVRIGLCQWWFIEFEYVSVQPVHEPFKPLYFSTSYSDRHHDYYHYYYCCHCYYLLLPKGQSASDTSQAPGGLEVDCPRGRLQSGWPDHSAVGGNRSLASAALRKLGSGVLDLPPPIPFDPPYTPPLHPPCTSPTPPETSLRPRRAEACSGGGPARVGCPFCIHQLRCTAASP